MASNNNSNLSAKLWSAADKLRANSKLKASEFAVPVVPFKNLMKPQKRDIEGRFVSWVRYLPYSLVNFIMGADINRNYDIFHNKEE